MFFTLCPLQPRLWAPHQAICQGRVGKGGTWICFLKELNQSNTVTGQILTTHHWQTLSRHRLNQLQLVSS